MNPAVRLGRLQHGRSDFDQTEWIKGCGRIAANNTTIASNNLAVILGSASLAPEIF